MPRDDQIVEYVTKHPGVDAEDLSDHFGTSCFEMVEAVNRLLVAGRLERDAA